VVSEQLKLDWIESTFNDDGKKTVSRSMTPRDFTLDELAPWLSLAQSRIKRQQSTENASCIAA
jgi:hypothetical protein